MNNMVDVGGNGMEQFECPVCGDTEFSMIVVTSATADPNEDGSIAPVDDPRFPKVYFSCVMHECDFGTRWVNLDVDPLMGGH